MLVVPPEEAEPFDEAVEAVVPLAPTDSVGSVVSVLRAGVVAMGPTGSCGVGLLPPPDPPVGSVGTVVFPPVVVVPPPLPVVVVPSPPVATGPPPPFPPEPELEPFGSVPPFEKPLISFSMAAWSLATVVRSASHARIRDRLAQVGERLRHRGRRHVRPGEDCGEVGLRLRRRVPPAIAVASSLTAEFRLLGAIREPA